MKPLNILLICFTIIVTSISQSLLHAQDKKHIAITAIVEHPALNATREGIKKYLDEKGYGKEDIEFTFKSAQGSPATAAQIARQFVGEKPDIIIAIATPSAQAIVAATKEIPVVFSAVTDPIAAKLVANLQTPGANVTGLSDMLPVNQQIDLIRKIMPEVKTLGIPYNPGEANSVSSIKNIEKITAKKNIKIIKVATPNTAGVMTAAQSLIGKADAIYVITDNTIVSAFETISQVGRENKLPIFAADTATVERGAIATIGFDYFELGRQTGEIVLQILKGTKPANIPIAFGSGSNIFVNRKAAAAMGIQIPYSVLSKANKIIE